MAWLGLVLLAPVLPEGTTLGGVVGREPAPRLRTARAVEEIRAETGPDWPASGGRMFSVTQKALLEEVYLPMARDGRLRTLFILLPSEEPMSGNDLSEIRSRLGAAGVPERDTASFRLRDGAVSGDMEGTHVRFVPLPGVPPGEGRVDALLLDPAFLLGVYRNEVKTPIVDLAWKLIATLREKSVQADEVVLLDLPSLLKEMVLSPESFAKGPPEKWELLRQAEYAYSFAQFPEATDLYSRYLRENPADASASYKIAMMAIRDLDDDMALQWLNRAAAADPRYAFAFAEASGHLVRMRRFETAERILQAGAAAFPEDRRMATSLASFYLRQGIRLREAGDTGGAAGYFGMAAGVRGADPQVVEKANALRETGEGAPGSKGR